MPLGEIVEIEAPDHWAPYLVNHDASGLAPDERAKADAWKAREGVTILDVARDESGEPKGPRITWHYRLFCRESRAAGGSLQTYLAVQK